jgi:hypothetical protein
VPPTTGCGRIIEDRMLATRELPHSGTMEAVPFSVIASLASSVVLRTFAPPSSMAVKS